MIKELGAMMSLLSNKGKIQEEMRKFETAMGQLTAEGSAGAGYVTARVSGRMEVQSVKISEEAMSLNDREMLEDLIAAAVNDALRKMRVLVAEETGKMTANLGLPPGMLGNLSGSFGAG